MSPMAADRRRTRSKGAYGYIHARYIHNRSRKTGKPVTRNLKRLIYYNVYGNPQVNPSGRPRGQIYDQDQFTRPRACRAFALQRQCCGLCPG